MVVVDQPHEVVERGDGSRVIEGEPVAVGELAPGGADVVQVDALEVIGGVVSPLPYPLRVEARFVGVVSVGVDRQPGQQGS